MSYRLRPYQQRAVDATVEHFRSRQEAACIVLPTGAGKSLVIAELCRLARGRVLVLAHVKELCQQNYDKFKRLCPEANAGLFSAGLSRREVTCQITFASVQSVAPHLDVFSEPWSLIIIDECHRVSLDDTSQYARVLQHARSGNEKVSVLGLTATPFRMGMGFCYQRHAWGMVRSETTKPFARCIFEVTLGQMIEQGYLCPPQLVDAPIAQYDFSTLESGHTSADPVADEAPVNELLVRHHRVTRAIIEQVEELSKKQNRRGVMIFAATVEHAREIAGYLPAESVGLILGSTEVNERDATIARFCEGSIRYLVNVAVLTTGFDAPHVDFIALLRRTESVSLYQQIVGRGLRLFPGKEDCLVIDYAGNGYSLTAPEIGEQKPNEASEMVRVPCPKCGFENDFWGILDGEGHVVEHYGRRCAGFDSANDVRCDFRFRFKECPSCNAENDIAARSCAHCAKALVDPDDLLRSALGLKDALVLRVSGVEYLVKENRLTLVYHDEDGATVKEHFDFDSPRSRAHFNRVFSRRIASGRRPLELLTAQQAEQLQHLMPHPDFVVARAKKMRGRLTFFQIKERVFDYDGPRRKAIRAD